MSQLKSQAPSDISPSFDAEVLRADFPILKQKIHRQRELIYFDNGATTQHPQSVIDAMSDCYRETYANVHRGTYALSQQVSEQYENARNVVQTFLNAKHSNEIVFTSGTTAAINLIARAWGGENLESGDEILLTIFEHHSNIVPWQQIAAQKGSVVKFVGITAEGELDWDDFEKKLGPRTKVVAVAATSNVLGTRVPISKLANKAKAVGAITVVDAAQHTPHEKTDVQDWEADFVVFSGHKMLGPTGIGVLWGKQQLLEEMPPFLGGGGMINRVTTVGFSPGELPTKFEAGTPPIVEAIGLAAAIEYLNRIPFQSLKDYETQLTSQLMAGMSDIAGLRIFGPPATNRAGIVSFIVEGLSGLDLAQLLDLKGIAIRIGHHCTMPLHDLLGVRASCRASFYLYNTPNEVDQFLVELRDAVDRLRRSLLPR